MPDEINSNVPASLLKQLVDQGVVSPLNLMMAGAQEAWRIPEYAGNIANRGIQNSQILANRAEAGQSIMGAPTQEELAALPPNMAGNLADYARTQREGSQSFYRGQSSVAPDSFAGKLYQGLGSLPVGLFDWTPAGTAMGMTNSAIQGDMTGAAMQGANRLVGGAALNKMSALPDAYGRQVGSAIVSGAGTAAMGSAPEDVLASTLIGGILPVAKTEAKYKAEKAVEAEKVPQFKQALEDKYKTAIGLDTSPTSGGYKQQRKEIDAGTNAVLNLTKSRMEKNQKLPENALEDLIAHGERKAEVRDTYMPMIDAADAAGVKPDLHQVAYDLWIKANDKVLSNEFPADSLWLEAQAARLEAIAVDKNGYTNRQLDEIIRDYNDKLYSSRGANEIPQTGSVRNIKMLNDTLREALIKSVETPRGSYQGNPEFAALRREYGALAENEYRLDGRVRREGNKISKGIFSASGPVINTVQSIASGLHGGSVSAAYAARHALKALGSMDDSTRLMYNTAKKLNVKESAAPETGKTKPSKGIEPFAVNTGKIDKENLGVYDYNVEEDPFH